MKKLFIITSFLLATLLFIGNAFAWHVKGKVYCDTGNGILDSTDIPLNGVSFWVQTVDTDFWFANWYTTSSENPGYYNMALADAPFCYEMKIDPATLPTDARFITPSNPVRFCTTGGMLEVEINWLIYSPTCQEQAGACWMTAGGVKFDSVLAFNAAQKGPTFNFGGNTYPGCSPTAGDGGQWSFVDHFRDIHFQAWVIDKVKCGNVVGIPPGSTSPVTPFNYIEFSGTGTVKPVAGNGAAKGKTSVNIPEQGVYYWARFEDRNEPGNSNALDPFDPIEGKRIDRLYLRVCSLPCTDAEPPNPIYLIKGDDGDPFTLNDTVLITGGNIQIHISSCP